MAGGEGSADGTSETGESLGEAEAIASATPSTPLFPGVVYGLTAAVLVYLTIVLLLAVEVVGLVGGESGGLTPQAFLLGSIGDFYSAHAGATTGIVPGIRGVTVVPTVLYVGVPFGILAWSGSQCARPAADPRRATVRGGSIVLGYAAATLLSFVVVARFDAFVGIDPRRIFVVVGLCYPALVGGVSGYLTAMKSHR